MRIKFLEVLESLFGDQFLGGFDVIFTAFPSRVTGGWNPIAFQAVTSRATGGHLLLNNPYAAADQQRHADENEQKNTQDGVH